MGELSKLGIGSEGSKLWRESRGICGDLVGQRARKELRGAECGGLGSP